MFIELVDALRCPAPHEESWLVVSADRMEDRHIVEGTLGCHVCAREFPIRAGIADFASGTRRPSTPHVQSSDDQAMRLAALLDLRDATGFAVLLGHWGVQAPAMIRMADCPLVLVDPPDSVLAERGLSIIRTTGILPLAAGAARGMAIDVADLHGDHLPRVESAVRVTRVHGRVVGPASLPMSPGLRELARDDELWVAERETEASPLVTLHVRRGARG